MTALNDAATDPRQKIAALRRELDERTAERDEALAQQAATGEILSVISRSPADIQPVFEAIVTRAAALCEAEFSAVARLEGGLLHLVTVHSMSPAETAAFHSLFPRPPARNFTMGRAFVDARPVHFEDVLNELDYDTRTLELLQSVAKYRSFLGVPILREGRPIGVIGCGRREVKPFTRSQIELVKTFADQAAIAIENARLITETREALDQQTATAEVLQVINSSPGDLTSVFDAMVERAVRLCEADEAAVRTFDGKLLHLVAAHGEPDVLDKLRELGPSDLSRPGGLYDPFLGGERVVHIADVRETETFRNKPIARKRLEVRNIRTWLAVALRREGTLLGVINVHRHEVRPFSEKQIALLENFAAQAVIAIENARLLTETREALDQQTATAEVLGVINSSPGDLAPVFQVILDKAHTLCDATLGSLFLFDGELFRAAATHGYPEDLAKRLREGIVLSAAPQLLDDSVRWVHNPDLTLVDTPTARAVSGRGGVRTNLMLPLRKDGRLLGAISCNRQEVRPFTDKEIALLENFAAQAVIAMENARLLGELRERTRDLEESLEYQTATSDVLKVISRSTFDLDAALSTVVTAAARLCRADHAGVYRNEGGEYRWAAGYNQSPEYESVERAVRILPAPGTLVGRTAVKGGPVQILDAEADPLYEAKEDARIGNIHSMLGVPLLREGSPIGVIGLARTRIEPFTGKQVELVSTFADQSVIAIENARLLNELQARTDELTRSVAELQALEEVLRAVNSSLDLDTVLATIIGRAAQLSQADEGTIYEFDEAEEVFVPKSAFGMSVEPVEALRERRIKLGETHLGRSALLRAPIYVQDVQQDPAVPYAARTLPGIHAALAVPLLRDDKVVGGLVIRRRSEAGFAPTIPTLLQTFAGQAVLAIENARLFQEARRARTAAEAALADLHRAQDRLIQAEKMASLGQLTAGIAHEIKNPLNFVNNFAGLSVELLEELKETARPAIAGLAEDERADVDEIVGMLTGNLEKIAEHGRRADGIVKSMLEHSRGGSGERREVDLNGLVEEALNLAYHGARARDQSFNITLERDLDHALAPVELVPQDITRVFLNLFGNGFYAATKRQCDGAAPEFRPALKVPTHDLGAAVEIRIRDNGTGIPTEIRDKLFQPFFTTKPTGEGTGLSLSISWDIVTQQHGGTIEVDSRVGEFTEFTIHLPRARQATTTEAAA